MKFVGKFMCISTANENEEKTTTFRGISLWMVLKLLLWSVDGMEAMWNLKHRPSIFHFSRYKTRAFSFWLLLSRCCSTRQMCQIGSEIPVLSEACSFLSGVTLRNFKLLPRKVSKSCKFINVMTDYYHSQQPSAPQDKTRQSFDYIFDSSRNSHAKWTSQVSKRRDF